MYSEKCCVFGLRFSKSVEVTNQFWKWMFLHRGQAILISFMLSDLIIKSGPPRNEWELQLSKQWNFFLYEGLLCHHCFQQVLFMQLVLCTVFYKVWSRACLKSWHHNKQVFDFFSNVKLLTLKWLSATCHPFQYRKTFDKLHHFPNLCSLWFACSFDLENMPFHMLTS